MAYVSILAHSSQAMWFQKHDGCAGIRKRTEERVYETEHDEVEYVKQRPGICGMGSHWVGRPVRRTVHIPYQETTYELNRFQIRVRLPSTHAMLRIPHDARCYNVNMHHLCKPICWMDGMVIRTPRCIWLTLPCSPADGHCLQAARSGPSLPGIKVSLSCSL